MTSPTFAFDLKEVDSVATITSGYDGGTHQVGIAYVPVGGSPSTKVLTLSDDRDDFRLVLRGSTATGTQKAFTVIVYVDQTP